MGNLVPPLLAATEVVTFQQLTDAIEAHMREYPGHGRSCSCLDALIRKVRVGLALPPTYAPTASEEERVFNVELSCRVKYVIASAIRS